MTNGLLALVLFAAFSFGAIVAVARAQAYHVTCVGHGFYAGSDPNDGSFFSRVDWGCSSTQRTCTVDSYNVPRGSQTIYSNGTSCNTWSRDYGDYTECAGSAEVSNPGVFSAHTHYADNRCF